MLTVMTTWRPLWQNDGGYHFTNKMAAIVMPPDVTSPAETCSVVNARDLSHLQNFVLLYDKKIFLSGCKEPTLRFASRNCSTAK